MLSSIDIYLVVFVALLATFTIQIMTKVGIREKLINNIQVEVLCKLLECDFCLGFWIAFMFSALLSVSNNDPSYMIIPILSAPLTRYLL